MNGKIALAVSGVLGGMLALGVVTEASASGRYAYANVIDVQPVVRTVRVEQPRRECWSEQVTRHDNRNAAGAMILGGLIGGIIGNQVGNGSGRQLATAAGAVIGTSIGHDRASRDVRPRTSVERRCNTYTEYHSEERVDGYRVTYEYGGAAYVTRMRHPPGDRIRVQVSVRPSSY